MIRKAYERNKQLGKKMDQNLWRSSLIQFREGDIKLERAVGIVMMVRQFALCLGNVKLIIGFVFRRLGGKLMLKYIKHIEL